MKVAYYETRHNSKHFSYIVLRLFTFRLLLLQLLQKPKNIYLYFCYHYYYYHTTLLLNILLQILSYPGVVELTTHYKNKRYIRDILGRTNFFLSYIWHLYDDNCDKTRYHHRCCGVLLLWQKIMTKNGFSS